MRAELGFSSIQDSRTPVGLWRREFLLRAQDGFLSQCIPMLWTLLAAEVKARGAIRDIAAPACTMRLFLRIFNRC
jgi:hypothetical protein